MPGGEISDLRVTLKRSLGDKEITDHINTMGEDLTNSLRSLNEELAVARALLTAMEFLGTLELVAGGVLETQRSHSAIFAHTNLE